MIAACQGEEYNASITMNDTTPQFTAKMEEMFQRKSPSDRLLMGCSMFDFSKRLVINSILRDNPNISPANLRVELFRRFYGNDFNPVQQEKILKYLSSPRRG